MRRQLFIIPILFVLLVSFAAADFDVKSTAVKKDIFAGEVAEFTVEITNNFDQDDVISFSTQDSSWVLLTQQFSVPSGETKSFAFKLSPTSDVALGIHAISIKIKSARDNDVQFELFVVNVRPYDPIFGEYRPSVQFGVTIGKEVDPRKKIPVEIYMRNRNALDIGMAEIVIESDLFNDVIRTSLGPLEELRTEYLYEIDPLQEPGLFSLNVALRVKNATISTASQNYEVMPYALMTMDSEPKNFLFKSEEVITLENLGNAGSTKTINLQTTWLERIFTSSNPDSIVVKTDQGSSLQWDVYLGSQELKTITVTTNYRLPIIILLIIVILIALYYVMRSPLILSKEAIIGESEEGSQQLKIRVFIKNRTRKSVASVSVIDKIPGIAELIKKKSVGTLHPDKVSTQGKGTVLKWNLDNLEPFEERIITYEIKSKLKIIGNVSLPSTRTKFMDGNRERTIYSNKILVTN